MGETSSFSAPAALNVTALALSNFRNYTFARVEVTALPVVITGSNGTGKTNILEAISLLTPGRGIRRAKVPELDNMYNALPWAINAEIMGIHGPTTIGTGKDTDGSDKRIVKIDGKVARTQTDLGKLFTVLWLTPQMDTLFIEGNSARRNFIDRLVFSFDSEHATRVNAYEQVMRERNRLLENGTRDQTWFSALEHKMAEHGIAIAVARSHTIDHLNNAMALAGHSFPKAHITLSGVVEDALKEGTALQAENRFRELLAANRGQDAGAGRALLGTHRTQMEVVHNEKNQPAEYCSTGEQKAVLISIILAQARAGGRWHGNVPVMLLDEVVTHLDATRRQALFDEIIDIGAQAWLTGTDRDVFEGLNAQPLKVESGKISLIR